MFKTFQALIQVCIQPTFLTIKTNSFLLSSIYPTKFVRNLLINKSYEEK